MSNPCALCTLLPDLICISLHTFSTKFALRIPETSMPHIYTGVSPGRGSQVYQPTNIMSGGGEEVDSTQLEFDRRMRIASRISRRYFLRRCIEEQQADIGLGPFAQTAERMEAVDYSSSVFIGDRSMLAKKGAPEIDPWSFLMVMTPGVWVCLVVSMLIVWTMVRLLPYISVSGTVSQLGMFTIFHQLGILLNQGIKWWMIDGKQRMVLAGWVWLGLVITLSYNCNLTSLLAVRRISHPVQTLRDLIDNPSLTVIMPPNTIITATIAVSFTK
ncbi:hypothetical protein Pcinc_003164 [Petrolisthes cinctipes]|uniref:Ionotropic glutamate receptor C-terminal domain-containing protein n=1 Tax=Petrolisthes cinctipes TaxID=88211 RepID=A0AAE1GJD7_PETCI|nr:hypothetical protein Pcinc_003164 [Petrolisthes cinctipes]